MYITSFSFSLSLNFFTCFYFSMVMYINQVIIHAMTHENVEVEHCQTRKTHISTSKCEVTRSLWKCTCKNKRMSFIHSVWYIHYIHRVWILIWIWQMNHVCFPFRISIRCLKRIWIWKTEIVAIKFVLTTILIVV